jgi:hypothetical protein
MHNWTRMSAVTLSRFLRHTQRVPVAFAIRRFHQNFGPKSSVLRFTALDSTAPVESVQRAAPVPPTRELPSKEVLFRIDWMLQELVPQFIKSRMAPLFHVMREDVTYDDKLFNYNVKGKTALKFHAAKVRAYFQYKSPFNKVHYVGSAIYENDDVIVLLWKLETAKSAYLSFLISFFKKQLNSTRVLTGALDIHVNPDGQIYKIVNRKATDADQEAANSMAEIRQTQRETEEKRHRRQIDQEFSNAKT